MSEQAIRCWIVHGKVQGVFFRASTAQQAKRLGLDGSAANLPDGTVRVVAQGDNGALDAMEEWLQHGPDQARVDRVVAQNPPSSVPEGFATG